MKYVVKVSVIVGAMGLTSGIYGGPMLCNGYSELCNRPYNHVAYAATHNGQSHIESDVHNQDIDITAQLDSGIRAIKIHVWYNQDEHGKQIPFVCHGIDKEYLYSVPMEKFFEQVPIFYRPFAKAMMEKLEPMKGIVANAFEAAYGHDNSAGLIPFNHCVLDPSKRPLGALLLDVRTFLDANPHEVVTLIVEDHTSNLDFIAADFKASGLLTYVHTQPINAPWPTLGQMIKDNKRLVVLLHGAEDLNYAQYPWMHYIWTYAWDTRWEFKHCADFKNCDLDVLPHRGKQAFAARHEGAHNKIFVVHHFVTDFLGGSKASAKKVNKRPVLKSRLERLAQQTGHIPNIIQVDFFQYPNNDIFDVVNELNGVGCYAGKPMCKF